MDAVQPEPIVKTRLWVAAAQAALLGLMFAAEAAKAWPATVPPLFAALYLPLLLVPLVITQGAAAIPGWRLAAWAAAAAVLGAVIGAHDLARRLDRNVVELFSLLPQPPAHAAYAAILFIGQALITAAALDRRRIATYGTLFEVAWKQGVQTVAGAGFTVVFWIVLGLGAELFKLINLTFLSRLIQHAWFAYPATTLAFAAAVHVTDIRPQIIRSIKSLILTLLSWLLPLATGIAALFLASLPFTGLAPLWATKSATPILLGCSAGLIMLLNAAYQDGGQGVSRPVRIMGTLAAVLLLPMVAIAGYGVALRVGQYGLTNDRVIASACIVVAACYALGYLAAARRWEAWLKPLERCNTVTAFVAIAVLTALFTPLADPARIATADQLARLESGKVPVDAFDFLSLRFDNGRYGDAALRKLQSAADQAVRTQAGRALAARSGRDPTFQALKSANLTAALTVAAGTRLPESFLAQDWAGAGEDGEPLAVCVRARTGPPCTAVLLDLDGDGVEEVAVIDIPFSQASVFRAEAGAWRLAGHIEGFGRCPGGRDLLAQGSFTFEAPAWRDVVVDGRRLTFLPKAAPCPK